MAQTRRTAPRRHLRPRTLEEKAAAILAELEDGIHDLYRIHAEALSGALSTKDETLDLWRQSKVQEAAEGRAAS